MDLLFGYSIALSGMYLSSLCVRALPCLQWSATELVINKNISSCLCLKRKLLKCVDFILLTVMHAKFSTGMCLSWFSPFQSSSGFLKQ